MKSQKLETKIRFFLYCIVIGVLVYLDVNKGIIGLTGMFMSMNLLYRFMNEKSFKKSIKTIKGDK